MPVNPDRGHLTALLRNEAKIRNQSWSIRTFGKGSLDNLSRASFFRFYLRNVLFEMNLRVACALAGSLGIVQFALWILQVNYVGNNYAAYIIGTTFIVVSSLGLAGLIPQERTAQSESVGRRQIHDSPRFWLVGMCAASCALAFWIANQIWTAVTFGSNYAALNLTPNLYGFNITGIVVSAAITALFAFGWRNAKYRSV